MLQNINGFNVKNENWVTIDYDKSKIMFDSLDNFHFNITYTLF